MKQPPETRELTSRLKASRFSGEGFLGEDTRPVDEIIAADLHTLAQLGITLEQVVAALRNAYSKARAALGGEVELRPGLRAQAHESMGRIPSPFRGDGIYEKGDVVIQDADSGLTLTLTALGIALIERHGFFQGHGNHYRIDPAVAVKMFGLAPQ